MSFNRLVKRSITSFETNRVRIIDSTAYLGMSRIKNPLSFRNRSYLIEQLFRAGVKSVEAGNMNCNFITPHTPDLLTDLKDIKYGERILSAAVVTPSMINAFITSGADELILPVNVRLPYAYETATLFEESIKRLRNENFQVRLQIDGAFDYCPDSLRSILQVYSFSGVSHITVLDTDMKANPAKVAILCDMIKKSFFADRISFAFKNDSYTGMENVYSALQENIRSFCVTVNGISNFIDIHHLLTFLNYHGFTHDIDFPEHIDNIKWWLHERMHEQSCY